MTLQVQHREQMMKCRICENENPEKFLSLGNTPLANSFLRESDLDKEEKTFPLELAFCGNCKLVQLTYVVPPELMFKHYVYVTSTTKTFQEHFSNMAEEVVKMLNLNANSAVVDIGSNDGLLLGKFKDFGVKTIGVEPAANLAELAEKNGIRTINEFFGESSVNKILEGLGKIDVVTATNVFAHVDDIKGIAENVKALLKDDGIFVIEVQYFMDTMEKMTFDNIYHEHLSFYTLTSLVNFFSRSGMEVFKVKRVDSHGGSLRVFVKKRGGKLLTDSSVSEMLEKEKNLGVENIETYMDFASRVQSVKTKLLEFMDKIRSESGTIAGYGAPAKSTTLLNFCGIGKDYIDYVIEDNQLKCGLLTPGTHIPVVDSSMLDKKTPDYILILAWNFAPEILRKTQKYRDMGVKFIIPLPEPMII